MIHSHLDAFSAASVCLLSRTLVQMVSATAFSTWSWHHLYLPSHKTLGQQLRICSREPLARHSGHAGLLARPQQCRLDGLGRTSYTDWIRNLSLAGSDFQSSAQVILWAVICPSWSQLPACAKLLSSCSVPLLPLQGSLPGLAVISLSPRLCRSGVLCSYPAQLVLLPQILQGCRVSVSLPPVPLPVVPTTSSQF